MINNYPAVLGMNPRIPRLKSDFVGFCHINHLK